MTWVETAADAGDMDNVLASHSLNREALQTHLALYRTIMFGSSGLSRAERESMAVFVSAANDCHYWVIHHGAALAREGGQALVEAVASRDLDTLPERVRLLCRYALKLTVTPWGMTETDVLALREGGFSDRDIVDANQVVAYFNYVNRVADGLGVELEGYWPAEAREKRTYRSRPAEGQAG